MHVNPGWALVLLSAVACATGRRSIGDIKVSAVTPELPAQVITGYDFHVEEGRIMMTDPGNPTTFDFSAGEDGCLQGNGQDGKVRQVCRVAPESGDPGGATRWRSTDSKVTFTAQLSPDGDSVIVQSGAQRGQFILGQGPASQELRKRPELLGAAFAYGYVPGSSVTGRGDTMNSTFLVGQG